MRAMIKRKHEHKIICKILCSLIIMGIMEIVGIRGSMGQTPSSAEKDPNIIVQADPNIQAFFPRGYELFEKKQYLKAAPLFFHYVSKTTPDAVDYEWAEFFLGMCLEKLGLFHAAADTLTHLITRKPNLKIVSYCLEFFESTTRSLPFDRDLIIHTVICDQEYGLLEPKISDFINFYQGVFDWEQGFFQWGDEHFQQITPKSYYFYKYLYHKALLCIFRDQPDEAMALLTEIMESPFGEDDFAARKSSGRLEANPSGAGGSTDVGGTTGAGGTGILPVGKTFPACDLKNEAAITLARLLYEKENFQEAEKIYRMIQKPMIEQAQDLFERAWNHYRMGNPEKALGLLYAFEAPSFKNFFTPEYYLLKSFIYKDVCHYKKALSIVHEFKARYGQSLASIYARGEASDDPALLLLLLNKKKIYQNWSFLRLLEREKETLVLLPGDTKKDENPTRASVKGDKGGFFKWGKGGLSGEKSRKIQNEALREYLKKLYTLEIEKIAGELKQQIGEEYEKMANELLKYEEEAHLMEYEIGLDMYQRVNQYHYRSEEPVIAGKTGEEERKKVVYPFQGEYWNDELDDYSVTLTDKCNCLEEWDIFFQ